MTEQQTFKIENVGGIERAELTLIPGVNVLRGRNAIGKTSAMRAIVRAQGGGGELERRDGAARGLVEGPGVKLTIGKVVRATGQAELSLADLSPLATLIDPGIKDPEAAARARIRALAELLRVPVDDSTLDALCQGDAALRGWLEQTCQDEAIDDLLTASEKLRGYAHGLARTWETKAENAQGRAQAARTGEEVALGEIGGPTRLVDLSPQDARAALIEGSRQYERLEAECNGRERLEVQQAKLRETIGERPDWEGLERKLRESQGTLESLMEELRLLEGKIAGTRQRIEGLTKEGREARARAEQWDRAQEILSRTPEGPTREELALSKVRLVHRAEEELELAQHSAAYRAAEATRQEAEETRMTATHEAERLRGLAADLPAVLGQILASAGAEGITVADGRLCAMVGGVVVDWERRLSDGERISRALDLAVKVYEGVVPLSDAFWMRLDPANRAHLAAEAQARGLFVLTEEPADGELRVEHA